MAQEGGPTVPPPGPPAGGGANAQTAAPAKTGPKTNEARDLFFFHELLDEVYLLLDFVSGNCAKQLDDLADIWVPDAPPESAAKSTPAQILAHIAKVRYPPEGSFTANAQDAAFLLLVKDKLTRMAAPAFGMTIAFTKMVVSPPSRSKKRELAAEAFADLQSSAKWFRRMVGTGIVLVLALTFFTFYTAYAAATGRSVLQRLEEIALTRVKVADAIKGLETRAGETATADAGVRLCPDPAAAPELKDTGAVEIEMWLAQQLAKIKSPTVRVLCDQKIDVERQWTRATQDLVAYQGRLLFPYELVLSRFVLPWSAHPREGAQQGTGGDPRLGTPIDPRDALTGGRPESEQWVAAMVAALAGSVLVWLFTLLGTSVSILRDIYTKVHNSTLAPRDMHLSLTRLALGMVAGAAIGLFFSPTQLPLGSGVGGTIAISAAGFAFLAGYGVDSVFGMFDSLLRRLASGVENRGAQPGG
ncbi:MAG: hypothetical protein HY060_10025 [Proteobacteria bacterium]|nr:hypothetical protein [Pseudomonadota bacterium]